MIKTSLLVISREVFYFHEQIGFACVCVTVLIIVALLAKRHWRNNDSS